MCRLDTDSLLRNPKRGNASCLPPPPCLTRASWASPAVPPKWALIYREGGKVTAHGLSLLSGRDHTLFSARPGVLTFLREPQYLWESHDPCLLAAMAAVPLPSSIPCRGQGCRRIFAPEDKTALRTTYPWVPESPSVTSTRTKILPLKMVCSQVSSTSMISALC